VLLKLLAVLCSDVSRVQEVLYASHFVSVPTGFGRFDLNYSLALTEYIYGMLQNVAGCYRMFRGVIECCGML
jgi:hypothetical protein